jgi:hypothetical protein
LASHIFEENHRCSKKTPQSGPRTAVGAANLAAATQVIVAQTVTVDGTARDLWSAD